MKDKSKKKVSLRQQIRQLESDLFAQTVLREEVRHLVPQGSQEFKGLDLRNFNLHERYVVERPRITLPNFDKIDEARAKLKEIYDSLKWYNPLLKIKVKSILRKTNSSYFLDA